MSAAGGGGGGGPLQCCDNCQRMRTAFVCPGCLLNAVRDRRRHVLAAYSGATDTFNEVAPRLAARDAQRPQTGTNTNDVVLNLLRRRLDHDVVQINRRTNEVRGSNIARRERLERAEPILERALAMLEPPEQARDRLAQLAAVADRSELALRLERRRIIKTLFEDLYVIKRVSMQSCSIADLILPDDCLDLHHLLRSSPTDTSQSLVTALGYVVLVVDLIAGYMGIKVPHPLTFVGSESFVSCKFFGRRSTYRLSLSSPSLVFQTGMDLLDQDLRFVAMNAGLTAALLPQFAFLPNLLVVLEAVKLAPSRSRASREPCPPPTPLPISNEDALISRDCVVIES